MNRLLRFTLLIAAANLMISLMMAATSSASTYYVAANGNDSNSGTSKTSPWLHAPGMASCNATCGSAAPQPGDSVIFRGGDTWHFGNSSLTPYTGNKSWGFSYGGSSSSPIYIGVDQTWFTGPAWVRPIFTGDDAITTSAPSSCVYDFNNINVVNLGTQNHLRLDNIEMSGFCYSAPSGTYAGFVSFGGTDAIIENMYFHGMTKRGTNADTDDEQTAIHGNGHGYIGDLTNQCLYNVFDNSDGTYGNTSNKAVLMAIEEACAVVGFSVFNHLDNGLMSQTTSVHDSLFTNMYDPDSWCPSSCNHGNIWNVDNDELADLGTQLFYNNMVYNINEGVGVWFMPTTTAYYFNNVVWNYGNNGANCVRTGGSNIGSSPLSPVTQLYVYNNVWAGPCIIDGVGASPGGDPAQDGPVYFANNQFIGYGMTAIPAKNASTSLTQCDAASGEPGATVCIWTDNGTNLWSGTGYSSGNNYAPTSSGGLTVGAGTNFTSLCPTFSSDKALCSGTSGGVAEVPGSGGQIASYPAIPVNQRPTGTAAWDVGPYQFAAGNGPAPPTGLSVSVQ